mmetsp:Transcript_67142/g.165642  ORF Transcript_67142/g.165642 Transcript_67142/m.165642 type:complete len:771 (-) Transcript_67142:8486-10798(-)
MSSDSRDDSQGHSSSGRLKFPSPKDLLQLQHTPQVRKGYLLKENPHGFISKQWKRRYFVLSPDGISYHEAEGKPTINEVFIKNVKSVTRVESKKHSGVFEMATNIFQKDGTARVFLLRANDDADADEWVHAIAVNMRVHKEGSTEHPAPSTRDSSLYSAESYESLHSEEVTSDGDVQSRSLNSMSSLHDSSLRSNPEAGPKASPNSSWNADMLKKSLESDQKPSMMFPVQHKLQKSSSLRDKELTRPGSIKVSQAEKEHERRSSSPEGGSPVLYPKSPQRSPVESVAAAKSSALARANSKRIGMDAVRRLVSKNKRRFEEDGFSLDLTYITPNLIAMGYPSDGMEGSYRNHITDVYRFFETKHPDSYLLFNLCSERTYDPARFHHRVEYWPFDDHNPPPFEMIRPLCIRINSFLSEKEDRVVAVHCKAGKGRTGVMTVCNMLHTGLCQDAEEALDLYGELRTVDGQGVTIKSQRRYCQYFFQNLGMCRPLVQLQVSKIFIYDPPAAYEDFVVKFGDHGGSKNDVCQGAGLIKPKAASPYVPVDGCGLHITGDVLMRVCATKKQTGLFHAREEVLCSAWFHTSFIDNMSLRLGVDDLDGGPAKDKKREKFRPGFAIEVLFDEAPSMDSRVHHPDSGIKGKVTTVSSDKKSSKPTTLESTNLFSVRLPSDDTHSSDMSHPDFVSKLSEDGVLGVDASSNPPIEPLGRVIMLYAFDPHFEDQKQEHRKFLRTNVNDVVTVLKKDELGWWLGTMGGEVGWFPQRYCAEVVDEEE